MLPNPADFDRLDFGGGNLGGIDIWYTLRGFVQHFGTESCNGHYIARFNKGDGVWRKQDDDTVTREGTDFVQDDGEEETVYMLFYEFET